MRVCPRKARSDGLPGNIRRTLSHTAQHLAQPFHPINLCAAQRIDANFALFLLKDGRIIRFPNLSREFSRVIGQRFSRVNVRQNSLTQKFVGKSPTEILDYSVNQMGRVSDFR